MKFHNLFYSTSLGTLLILASATPNLGCSKQEQEPQMAQQPQPYEVYKVKKQDMSFDVEFSASFQGINDVDIYPQVNGTIQEIRFEEGQMVHKDDVLFVIDKITYEAVYENAKASVASAEAVLATATLNKSNMDKLYNGSRAVSYYDMQKSHNEYNAALASLAEAEANVKKAKRDLDYTEVRSPVDGLCSMMNVRLGTLVSSNQTTPMVTVSDNSKIQAYFSVSENLLLFMDKAANAGHIRASDDFMQNVHLKLADGSLYDKTGELTASSGIIDKKTGAITCRATFPNDDQILKAGGSGSVVISVIAKDGLVIPQTATYEIQDKTFVYKIVDGKAKATVVELMVVDDGHHYVVTKGLNEGDEIVANGVGLLHEGTPIAPKPYTGDQQTEATTEADKAQNGSADKNTQQDTDSKSAPAAGEKKDSAN